MTLPDVRTRNVFNAVPAIVGVGPLVQALGSTRGGEVVSCRVGAVKVAGHARPTMAGAWPMTHAALIDRAA